MGFLAVSHGNGCSQMNFTIYSDGEWQKLLDMVMKQSYILTTVVLKRRIRFLKWTSVWFGILMAGWVLILGDYWKRMISLGLKIQRIWGLKISGKCYTQIKVLMCDSQQKKFR